MLLTMCAKIHILFHNLKEKQTKNRHRKYSINILPISVWYGSDIKERLNAKVYATKLLRSLPNHLNW